LLVFFYEFLFNILHLLFVGVKKLKEKYVLMSENESDKKATFYSSN